MRPLNIFIINLNGNGTFPCRQVLIEPTSATREAYLPWTVTPANEQEADALRAWICTHQTMFLLTGAATTALTCAMGHVAAARTDESLRHFRLATKLRLASSVYTMLPTVERPIYETYIRPAMTGARKGFSGVSSREAIAFAAAVQDLRVLSKTLVSSDYGDSEVVDAVNDCLRADDTWWRLHGGAMSRMVNFPTSLAQQEFRRRSVLGDITGSHAEFLSKELQTPEACDIYDKFFGCQRNALAPRGYVREIEFSLEMSDPFISFAEPYGRYRRMLGEALPGLLALADGK